MFVCVVSVSLLCLCVPSLSLILTIKALNVATRGGMGEAIQDVVKFLAKPVGLNSVDINKHKVCSPQLEGYGDESDEGKGVGG